MMMVVLLVLCLGGAIAGLATRPAGAGQHSREERRRRRLVQTSPSRATMLDVRRELIAAGLSADEARFITEKASANRIAPFTLWLWLEEFGATASSIVVAADLTNTDLLKRLSEGSKPDLDELRIFAALNGYPVAKGQSASRARQMAGSGASRPLQVYEPGDWDGLDLTHPDDDAEGGSPGLAA